MTERRVIDYIGEEDQTMSGQIVLENIKAGRATIAGISGFLIKVWRYRPLTEKPLVGVQASRRAEIKEGELHLNYDLELLRQLPGGGGIIRWANQKNMQGILKTHQPLRVHSGEQVRIKGVSPREIVVEEI